MIAKLYLVTLLLGVSVSVSGCASGNTTPSAETLRGVQLTKVSRLNAAFEVNDLRADRRNSQTIEQLVQQDLTSVLNPEVSSSDKSRYKFIVEVLEYGVYFIPPQWSSRIVLNVKIFSPNAELLGIINPAAHAFRFNTWGIGSAEDAEREARRAIATEFVRLSNPLLEGT
jgi:hypothetical protein